MISTNTVGFRACGGILDRRGSSYWGVAMRQLFVSYARENKCEVDDLVRHLETLGYEAWVDSSLHGGQPWWDEILNRIRECDAFVAILSRSTLRSEACGRERGWARQLNKPVLPVAVEPISSETLPRDLSMTHFVDYSTPGADSAFAVAGSLASLGPAGSLPEPLPAPPKAPLSYLTDLVDQLSQTSALSQEQQRRILTELEPAVDSADPEERQSARDILDRFSKRRDLFADVYRRLTQIQEKTQPPALRHVPDAPVPSPPHVYQPPPAPAPPTPTPRKRSKVTTTLAVLGALFIALIVWAFFGSVRLRDAATANTYLLCGRVRALRLRL